MDCVKKWFNDLGTSLYKCNGGVLGTSLFVSQIGNLSDWCGAPVNVENWEACALRKLWAAHHLL